MTDPTSGPTPTRDEAVIAGRTLEEWRIHARRDDCLERMVPSDLRQLIGAIPASAPAPASGRVDAVLNLYREAVRIDVKMEGPQFMGANSSALKRAWEADRASLSPAATPVSEAAAELRVRHPTRRGPFVISDAELDAALAKPASSPAPVRPIGNQGISDYQREIARNMAEGFAAWNAARQEAPPSDEPASSPAGGDVGDSVALSMDSDMRNSDFETWACKRGYLMHLHEGDESRRYRYSLTEEAWLGWCAALSQSTSAGRVGE